MCLIFIGTPILHSFDTAVMTYTKSSHFREPFDLLASNLLDGAARRFNVVVRRFNDLQDRGGQKAP